MEQVKSRVNSGSILRWQSCLEKSSWKEAKKVTASIRGMRNGAWLSGISHRLNVTELYHEEFQDNLCLRYGMMHQDIPATCNDWGKKLWIEHALSCPKDDLVLA